MQIALFRIWTWVAEPISYDNNRYITRASVQLDYKSGLKSVKSKHSQFFRNTSSLLFLKLLFGFFV